MIKTPVLALLLFTLALSACHPTPETSGPMLLSLEAEEIQVDAIVSGGSSMAYKDYLIKKTHYKDEAVFQIFRLPDDSFQWNSLRRGRGPGEIGNPASWALDEANGILWLADWNKNCMHLILLDSLVSVPSYKPSFSFPLKEEWIPTMNMFFHPSGNIGFTSSMLPKHLISVMDLEGNLVDSLCVPKNFLNDMYDEMGISDVPLVIRYIPHRNQCLVMSRWENKFWILGMDGTVAMQIDDIPEESQKLYTGDWEGSFYTVDFDETYLFFIYSGKKMIQFDSNGESTITYPKRLLVVDWEGNFLYDITLDHGIIFATLDKERKRLICDSEEVENLLVSYDLSWLYEE
ncbi:MAG: hypothetical protein R2751_10385 [Bacteroidales bacterium]